MQEPRRPSEPPQRADSEFLSYLKKGILIGAAVLLLIPAVGWFHKSRAPEQPPEVATAPQPGAIAPQAPVPDQEATAPRVAPAPAVRLADFRGEKPSAEARLVGNWVVATGNAQRHAFVLVDKKDAHVYVFGPDGRLQDSAPALMGAARGDDSYPGIGDKPLNQVKPYEKTTPAGRFVAEIGLNASNEDIVWVSYDLAVSMHRVRPLVARERRLERLATLTTDDNRISFGCINLPVSFYEDVLKPTVQRYGAVVYVLPEVKSPQQVFGAYDVTDPRQAAAAQARAQKVAAAASADLQKVSLPAAR
jgi:hypothetical protein